MKSVATGFVTLLGLAGAFPTLETFGTEKRQNTGRPQGAGALPNTPPPFDPVAQRVQTTGAHAWMAPGSGDDRGECPGLNAMANHAYLPRNGVATIQQFMDGTFAAVGMASDLSGFLAVYGAVVDGDGVSWSIGGGPHVGIGGSHHNYEADSSPLKSDLNQYGSNGRLIMSQFKTLYNMQPNAATANYNLDVLRTFRGMRFRESINKNPYFFYGPFDGDAVSQAAFTFIYRFMSNKSAEAPEGTLNKDVLKSWMSISGPENNLTWTFGHERIPDVFYKRNPTDSYSIPYFISDVDYFVQQEPEIFSIGCNTGTVNSFMSISSQSLSDGQISQADVAKNPFCFGINYLKAAGPSVLGLSGSPLTLLNSALTNASTAGSCTAQHFNTSSFSQFKSCPGFTVYGGPTGPVAPGAIQS